MGQVSGLLNSQNPGSQTLRSSTAPMRIRSRRDRSNPPETKIHKKALPAAFRPGREPMLTPQHFFEQTHPRGLFS